MTNLWCYHAAFPGHWVPGNGFNRVLPGPFTNMADLQPMIAAAAGTPGSIDRLGILVHGDEGELKTGTGGSNRVTPERILNDASLRAVLTEIGTFLSTNATVSFYSCSAAASERGTRFLMALSKVWPGRTVVGAISKGFRFATLTAGDFSDTLLTVIEQVTGTDQYYVPGQSTRPGRGQFFLPATLPRFLSVAGTVKKAKDGAITQMPSGPAAFHEFESRYPAATRDLILSNPAQLVVESDRQFYSTFLINMDWPANAGRAALLDASRRREFAGW